MEASKRLRRTALGSISYLPMLAMVGFSFLYYSLFCHYRKLVGRRVKIPMLSRVARIPMAVPHQ